MKPLTTILFASFWTALVICATPPFNTRPFKQLANGREVNRVGALEVDLGYEVYQGSTNTTLGLNIWQGIRYAAPPTGTNRWQAPRPPASNRSSVIHATMKPPSCPWTSGAGSGPQNLGYEGGGQEDCLFLNIYAPSNGTNLPVLVWIHGGGFGLGSVESTNMPFLVNANQNSFIGVAIQYRLGAFGFLASDEVYRNGVVNAGLLDQQFALQWVQEYISLFGGNASLVTLGGESSGASSVTLQAMAYGGILGESLFINGIAASPAILKQYRYNDWVPSQNYYAFAAAAGCNTSTAYGSSSQTIFQCLVAQNTSTLTTASNATSKSALYGSWAFLPVTDGVFIQNAPSEQLLQKRVNGINMLIGNNADEGPLFTKQNITTEVSLVAWLRLEFPQFTNDDIAKVLYYYPSTNASVNPHAMQFDTLGYAGPSALNQSDVGTGQQQRADNIWAESAIVCPSYWLAEAYVGNGKTSFKYQYSVPAALHGTDFYAYFGPPTSNQGPDFVQAFTEMYGNFIRYNNPSISAAIALGASAMAASLIADSTPNITAIANPATNWPPYAIYAPYQLNLNQSGGTPFSTLSHLSPGVNTTEYEGTGLRNNFTLVNAYTWEAGRGTRCDFWRAVASLVPM